MTDVIVQPFLSSISELGWRDLLMAMLKFTREKRELLLLNDCFDKVLFEPFASFLLSRDVYSSVKLSELPDNYRALMEFISQLQVPKDITGRDLYLELTLKRWPFSLFYQIKQVSYLITFNHSNLVHSRFNRVVEELERRYAAEREPVNVVRQLNQIALEATESLWNSNQLIGPLIGRFWRLIIQIWQKHRLMTVESLTATTAVTNMTDILRDWNELYSTERQVEALLLKESADYSTSNSNITSTKVLLKSLEIERLVEACEPKLIEKLVQLAAKQTAELLKQQLKNVSSQFRRTNRPASDDALLLLLLL